MAGGFKRGVKTHLSKKLNSSKPKPSFKTHLRQKQTMRGVINFLHSSSKLHTLNRSSLLVNQTKVLHDPVSVTLCDVSLLHSY